jgi:hypothetical protein
MPARVKLLVPLWFESLSTNGVFSLPFVLRHTQYERNITTVNYYRFISLIATVEPAADRREDHDFRR